MDNHNKLLLLMLLSMLCVVPRANASEVEAFTLDYEVNTYIETKIVVSYSFTQNVTSDASSAGQSVWQVSVNPLVTTFSTSASDRFTWHLTVSYNMIVVQTITIAVFSGDEAVDSLAFNVKTDTLQLNFDITVTEQPHYPTAEQLADKSIEVLSNRLAEYVAEMRTQNDLSRQHDTAQWFVVLITFCGFIILYVVPKLKEPKHKERQ
jgi:hypothetical protein